MLQCLAARRVPPSSDRPDACQGQSGVIVLVTMLGNTLLGHLRAGALYSPAPQPTSEQHCRRLSKVHCKTRCPARCRRQHPTSLPAVAAPAQRYFNGSLGAKASRWDLLGSTWGAAGSGKASSLLRVSHCKRSSSAGGLRDGPSPTGALLLWHRPQAVPVIRQQYAQVAAQYT